MVSQSVFTSLILVLISTSANARFVDGNTIMEWSTTGGGVDNSSTSNGLLMGFVIGVVDANVERWAQYKQACIPRGVQAKQLVTVTTRYLKDNPQELSRDGFLIVHTAMSKAFPCREK